MSAVLAVREATKRFAEVRALDGATVELLAGETLALLGPNGAGKTTLVRAIAGRVALDGGTVELFGAAASPEGRRKLGIVPQEIALYPLLTAGENLEVFGRFHGLSGAVLRERVGWALNWTGLGSRAREPVKGFSGGMKRRLNIASGILHRPEVILLDEPTVGVDPQSRERIWEMLTELRAQGASLLLTTHHLEEAEERSDRIVIVDHGKTVASGTLRELLERTFGSKRTIRIRLAVPAGVPPDGFSVEDDGRTLRGESVDAAATLASVLESLRASGAPIEDVRLEGGNLHGVFLALTGRELRE